MLAAAIGVEWRAGVGYFLYCFNPGEDSLHNDPVVVVIARIAFGSSRNAPLADVENDLCPICIDRAGGGDPVEVEGVAGRRSVFCLMGVISRSEVLERLGEVLFLSA